MDIVKSFLDVFDFDSESGVLYWKSGLRRNSRQGMIAGCVVKNPSGRKVVSVRVNGKQYLAHRIIFAIHNGRMPIDEIDHINGDSMDNRVCNLRDVSSLENARNMKRPITNSSGFNGVTYDKVNKKWRAKIKIKGKTICLGRYIDINDAIEARKNGNIYYGFHKNHGRSLNA